MKTNVHPLSRRLAALFLALLFAVPTVYADAGEQKFQTSTQILDGLTYRNTVTENNGSRVESFSLELSPDSAVYPILGQGSGFVYGVGNINRAISIAQQAGRHVVAAVNSDFFSMSSGVPIGIVVEDGVYKSSGDGENAMLITDGRVSVMGHPQVSLSLTNQRTGDEVVPRYFNKQRSDYGGMYLLTQDFSAISSRSDSAGWYVRMKLVDSGAKLTVNSSLTLEVIELLRSDQSIVIGEDEYVLTAADQSGYGEVFDAFQTGDRVTLTTVCADPALSAAQWAGGVGDIMIQDGALTDSSTWVYATDGRQPRTAMGMKADGTLVLYATDGRQSGYSIGLSQKDLAQELLAQGCLWAVNLDGGGSTSVSVWLPGQSGPKVQNRPSGGSLRSCATYLLLVTDQTGSGVAQRLALPEDGQVVLTGSKLTLSQPTALDDGLNLISTDLSDATVTARNSLGVLDGFVYTAGGQIGVEDLGLRSGWLDGSATLYVVDRLTALTVTRAGSAEALTSLRLKPGEQVQLAVSGSYWGRAALRDWSGVTCAIEGDIGSIDANGVFTAAQMPASGSITVSAGGLTQTIQVTMSNVHNDVPPEHWAYAAVEYCYEHGIVSGVSSTEFGGGINISRGDFMLMIHSALGRPAASGPCTFIDVPQESYYYSALAWAQEVGLAAGGGDGTYAPTAPITREQAFTILRQALPFLGKSCPDAELFVLDAFIDKDLIADYAKGHVATLVSQGIVSGNGMGINPQGCLTRAEMAAILYKSIIFTPITDLPVDPSLHTLTLDQTEVVLASGESVQLSAIISSSEDDPQIIWTCDNSAAVVSSSGLVTNLHAGFEPQTVTVTASWHGLNAQCTVTCSPAQRVGVVTDAELGLYVRSGPGTEHPIVGGLANDSRVIVLSSQEGWHQILFRNHQGQAAIGYVSGDYLTVTP